jgi:hypothetical protein
MKVKDLFRKYLAVALLLAAVVSLFTASILLLVSIYLLVMELFGQGELQAFCSAPTNCHSRWWAPMVSSLVLMLVSGVLWPMGVRKWRERPTIKH